MSDIEIKNSALVYEHFSYFRVKAEDITAGSVGRKRGTLNQTYVEEWNRIPNSNLTDYVKFGEQVAVTWSEQKASEVEANGKFTYYSASAAGGVKAGYAEAKSLNLKLIKFSIEPARMQAILNNDANSIRRHLREEGNDGRVVLETWYAIDQEGADLFESTRSGKASFAATIGGGDLSVTASSTTGTRRSVTVNISASTFAYEPYSVRSWTNDDKVDGLTGDEHGI
jgi:hypothetical protein